jgi:hypothetical protein
MNFRGMMKCVSGACCAAAVMMCASGVGGMIMEGEAVHISESQQFFQIDAEQAKNIRSISFEKQNINEAFFLKWHSVLSYDLVDVVFDQCRFLDDFALGILNGTTLTNLTITNSGISAEDAQEILSNLCSCSIRCINFSKNKLGENENLFEQVLQDKVYRIMCLSTFNLKENNFSNSFIEKATSCDVGINFIF